MTELAVPELLLTQYHQVIEKIKTVPFVRVLAHYDTDGVASAVLIAKILILEHKPFQISFIRSVNKTQISKYLKNDVPLAVFVDIGAAVISALEEYQNVIVLDHHPPEKRSESVIHVNPWFVNLDGGKDACGATLAFILAQYYNAELWSLYPLFLAGVIGDKQDLGGYTGLNKIIIEKLSQFTTAVPGLRMDGSTLYDMLLFATHPYLPGVTGNKKAVDTLLQKLHISATTLFVKLSEDKKEALASYLTMLLLEHGIVPENIENLITPKFYIQDLNISANTLSEYINACTRSDHHDIALAYLMGDLSYRPEIEQLWRDYKKRVITELERIKKEVVTLKNLQYFYSYGESLCGSLAGVAMLYLLDPTHITVCLHTENNEVHISSRASPSLIRSGVDLGTSIKIAAEQVGGFGGGHKIAAGATVPKSTEKRFLEIFDKLLEK